MKVGDVFHWTVCWSCPIDMWGIVIGPENDECKLFYGTAKARTGDDRDWVKWYPGSTLHLNDHNEYPERFCVTVVPPKDWPDEVCVALAKQALLGEDSGEGE